MSRVHLSSLAELNSLSMTNKGCLQIAESFVSQIKNNLELQNPWVTWQSNPKILGELLYQNRGKKLSGLLYGAKDIIASQDFPTKMGAPKIWKNSMMGFDARIISHIKSAGGVLAGKTKTSEFAVHEPTDVINPRNSKRTAGTSSAGSSAAVANSSIKMALGTQTAGSIARPASYCEVFAYKPTFGDFPRTGILKTSDEFDSVGVFGDDLETISLVYNAVKVTGENYPLLEEKRTQSAILNVLVLGGYPYDSASDFLVNQLLAIGEEICLSLGVKSKVITESNYLVSVREIHEDIYKSNLAYYFREELSSDEISASMRSFVNSKKDFSFTKFKKRQEELKVWRNFFNPILTQTLILTLGANSGAPVLDPTYDSDMNVVLTSLGYPQLLVPRLISDFDGAGVSVSFSMQQGSDSYLLETVRKLLEKMNLK
jgi:Asp-tRNA(Asn)/Glu-tRNA(Gln) amidotransferase A subunit family amidase